MIAIKFVWHLLLTAGCMTVFLLRIRVKVLNKCKMVKYFIFNSGCQLDWQSCDSSAQGFSLEKKETIRSPPDP